MSARTSELSEQYPRIYRTSRGWLLFLVVLGGISIAGGTIGVGAFLFGQQSKTIGNGVLLCGLASLFIALGAYVILCALKSKVVLFEDRLEILEPMRVRVVRKQDVAGWRLTNSTTPPVFILTPKRSGASKIKLALTFKTDPLFAEWLHPIVNLDEEESRRSHSEIADDRELGSTAGDRFNRMKYAKRLAVRLNWLTLGVGAWGLFYPRPYNLVVAVLAVLPWGAAVIPRASRGAFRMDENRNYPHPGVVGLFMSAGLCLMLRAVLDVEILHWVRAMLFGGMVGLMLWAVALRSDRSMVATSGTSIATLLLSFAYGYGAIVEADFVLDQSHPTTYESRLISKEISGGKYQDHKLYLKPTGPDESISEASVTSRLYSRLQPGDPVCVDVSNGALNIAWYEAYSCHRQADSTVFTRH